MEDWQSGENEAKRVEGFKYRQQTRSCLSILCMVVSVRREDIENDGI